MLLKLSSLVFSFAYSNPVLCHLHVFINSNAAAMISVWRGPTTAPSPCARRPSARTTSPRSPTVWTGWRTGCPSSGRKEWYVFTTSNPACELLSASCYVARCPCCPCDYTLCSDEAVGWMKRCIKQKKEQRNLKFNCSFVFFLFSIKCHYLRGSHASHTLLIVMRSRSWLITSGRQITGGICIV